MMQSICKAFDFTPRSITFHKYLIDQIYCGLFYWYCLNIVWDLSNAIIILNHVINLASVYCEEQYNLVIWTRLQEKSMKSTQT